MKLKPYPKYKDSGIEWLGEIPMHWSIRKLKFVSSVKLSGVDKKTLDGELPVKLCNYTDVYKNEFISEELDFMKATATKNEIAKSTLNKGDVLITKDSETPDDIAVPSYVKSEFRNVLCGYHLAQIRANPKYAVGEYLFRLFCAQGIREQFTPLANGITRYGLSKYSIDNSIFPVPTIAEQKIISTYLDQKTAKIDKLIKKNEKLIELLKEKRQAIISEAVTKGLDPNAKMKDSGIEWIGEIPEGWEVRKLKFLSSIKLSGVDKKTLDGELPVKLCNYTDVYKNEFISEELGFMEATATKNEIAQLTIHKGDVLITKDSETPDDIAVPSYVKSELRNVLCGYHLARIRANSKYAIGEYLFWLFYAQNVREQFTPLANGITRYGLSKYSIDSSIFSVPTIDEQKEISMYIKQKVSKINDLIKKIESQNEKLKEYRQTLISNVVTGKVRVS